MGPMVSVVVATYKQDKRLVKALESLVNQTYDNYEIVLVNDNASNEWNEKIRTIVDDFRKNTLVPFQYIENNPNQGSAKTRNIGIKEAKGEYITFLDDDDIYLPKKIEHQISQMIEKKADYSITDLYLYNDDGKLIDKRVRNYILDMSPQSLMKYHLMYHMTGTDSMMYKKEYLMKIGGFDEIDLGDEFYLMQKAISENGQFSYINGCNIKAYVHTGEYGLSSGQNKIKCENKLHEFKKKYFTEIDRKSRRYINMRHHAVLAFAYLRIQKYGQFVKHGIMSFITSPVQCLTLVCKR